MDKVKLGIIGIGNMGAAHSRFIAQLDNAVLTAACDASPAAFDRLDPAVGKIARFTEPERFLREADVEGVILAMPHFSHPELGVLALECGKHILVEKPIAVDKAGANLLLNEGKDHPELVQCVMFNQRTIPAHRKIKELIDAGELGTVRRVNWIITDWFRSQCYYDSGDWRASWRGEGGGVLLNQCPHQLDLLQWFTGMPSKVRATVSLGKYHDIEVEDDVTAVLEYPSGATGVFIASTGEAPGTNRLEIVGDRGRLVLENGALEFLRNEIPMDVFCKTTKESFGRPALWKVAIPASMDNPHQHRDVIENFARAIRDPEHTPLVAPLTEGLKGLEIGNAILYSGLQHVDVTLPLDEKVYADKLAQLVSTSRYRRGASQRIVKS